LSRATASASVDAGNTPGPSTAAVSRAGAGAQHQHRADAAKVAGQVHSERAAHRPLEVQPWYREVDIRFRLEQAEVEIRSLA
jgi:hypothetical protein